MSARVLYACDKCGASETGSVLPVYMPEGWVSGSGYLGGPHLCPCCAKQFTVETLSSQPAAPLSVDWRPGQPVERRVTVAEWLGREVQS